jgi:hypothetical protein
MFARTRLAAIIPALCAILIVLRLTVLKTAHTSDLSLGLSVGVLSGISILSILFLRRRTA